MNLEHPRHLAGGLPLLAPETRGPWGSNETVKLNSMVGFAA